MAIEIIGLTSTGILVPVRVDDNGSIIIASIPAGSNIIGLVQLTGPIPAGSNLIGNVGLSGAIPAGSNLIGNVGLSGAIPAGANLIGKIDALAHGYHNSAWKENALTLGYTDTVEVQFVNLALPAGVSNHTVATVPASRVWVITGISMRYTGTTLNVNVDIGRYLGGVYYPYYSFRGLANNVIYTAPPCNLIAKPADVIRAAVNNGTLNDDLYVWLTGYYFLI